MKIYVVREYGVNKIHGFFWAKNLDDLWDAVDEMADPYLFEYMALTRPGGLWHEISMNDVKVTAPSDDDDEGFGVHPVGDRMSETTYDELIDGHKWVRFDAFNEGHGVLARIKKEAGNG